MSDLYQELGVGPDASEAEIKAAHRRAVKKAHPDAGGSQEAFQRVQRALAVLSDPGRRSQYDRIGDDREADPKTMRLSKAMQTVTAKMGMVINMPTVDPRYVDLVVVVVESLQMDSQTQKDKIKELQAQIKRQEQFARRLTRKKGAAGPGLEDFLKGNIANMHRMIAQVGEDMEVTKLALELARGYSYRTEPPEPVPMQMTRPFGSVFGGTFGA